MLINFNQSLYQPLSVRPGIDPDTSPVHGFLPSSPSSGSVGPSLPSLGCCVILGVNVRTRNGLQVLLCTLRLHLFRTMKYERPEQNKMISESSCIDLCVRTLHDFP